VSKYQHIAKIDQLISWGRHKEAIQEAGAMLQAYPEDADAFAMMSIAYRSVDAEKALYWSNETLRRDPEHEDAWRTKMFIYREQGNMKSFKETLDEILRIFPHKSYPFFYMAEWHIGKGKLQDAREALEQAISIHKSGLYLALYGHVLAKLNQSARSEQAIEDALRLEPESSAVLMYAGWAADSRGDYGKAQQYMNAAVRISPDDPQIRKEYLEMLQKQYWFYRVLLFPNLLRRLKMWQIVLLWIVLWIVFRPLMLLFLVLYVASHWISKLLVHIRVYGWTFPRKGR
jgi:tetratricopeptide (TPR) repeat protein